MDTTVLTQSVWLSYLFKGYGHDCLSRFRFSYLSLQKLCFKDTTVLTESASALLSLQKLWFMDTTVLTESIWLPSLFKSGRL